MSDPSRLERLVAEFTDSVIAQNDAIQRHDPKVGNAFARRYMKASDLLLSLGQEGVDALSVLLKHPRIEVRTMAACDLLPFRTEEALQVLEESAKGTGITALGAIMALERWRRRPGIQS
jgi:hypothetical protein